MRPGVGRDDRTEAEGGSCFGDYQLYNTQVTSHGLIMLFGFIMPVTTGAFANYLVPSLVGLPDMVFPRINVMSYLVYVVAGQLILVATYIEEGIGAGWTLYPTLTCADFHTSMSVDVLILSVHMFGLSSLLNAVNMIVTIFIGVSRGWTLKSTNLFVWSILFTSGLLVLILPVLAAGVSMILIDRNFNSCFFDVLGGGDLLMYQHIFWFFGHPEVYVIILPVFGLISLVIELSFHKPVFSSLGMIYSMSSISIIGFFVWAHHMFTVGLDIDTRAYFGSITITIGVPTAIKLFNWLYTLVMQRTILNIECLYLVLFILMFFIGGVTGLILANVSLDVQLHDTYFVVAHFHYVLSLGAVVGTLSGMYALIYYVVGLELYTIQLKGNFILFLLGSNLGPQEGATTTEPGKVGRWGWGWVKEGDEGEGGEGGEGSATFHLIRSESQLRVSVSD